jgi:outer membrane immunogenic protein
MFRRLPARMAFAVWIVSGMQVAAAADLEPGPVYGKAPMPAPVYHWTGFYVGSTLGDAFGSSDPSSSLAWTSTGYFGMPEAAAVTAAGQQHITPSGFTGGVEAGYNWQFGSLVWGVESDFEYVGLRGSASTNASLVGSTATATVESAVSTDWLFTARPRVGVASSNWLFYATGGPAVTDLKGNFSYSDDCGSNPTCNGPGEPNGAGAASFSATKVGYAVGGGVEAGLWDRWTLKAEYLFVDFSRSNSSGLIGVGAWASSISPPTAST